MIRIRGFVFWLGGLRLEGRCAAYERRILGRRGVGGWCSELKAMQKADSLSKDYAHAKDREISVRSVRYDLGKEIHVVGERLKSLKKKFSVRENLEQSIYMACNGLEVMQKASSLTKDFAHAKDRELTRRNVRYGLDKEMYKVGRRLKASKALRGVRAWKCGAYRS